MCGRYGLWAPEDDVAKLFDVDYRIGDFGPTYNAAPSQMLPVVFERYEDGAESPARRMQLLEWGLVPTWAKTAKRPMINARSETLLDKPSFKASARRQRCLVPANGYFEWQVEDGGKQPWFLSQGDGDPVMGFAGIFDAWQDPESQQWLRTFAIITRSAPDAVGHIHDRSPVVVPQDMWSDWLDPQTQDDSSVQQMLDAIPGPALHPRRVGKAVGNVRNNNPSLIEPID
ncbi:MAG: SOS response-associated peptidase [Actinomycetaceae bacterium]|nr:SOS response-associated peptidase [Actinomycetaceae bacterium]